MELLIAALLLCVVYNTACIEKAIRDLPKKMKEAEGADVSG